MSTSDIIYIIAIVSCIIGMLLSGIIIGYGFLTQTYQERHTRIMRILLVLGWIFVMIGLILAFGGILYEQIPYNRNYFKCISYRLLSICKQNC